MAPAAPPLAPPLTPLSRPRSRASGARAAALRSRPPPQPRAGACVAAALGSAHVSGHGANALCPTPSAPRDASALSLRCCVAPARHTPLRPPLSDCLRRSCRRRRRPRQRGAPTAAEHTRSQRHPSTRVSLPPAMTLSGTKAPCSSTRVRSRMCSKRRCRGEACMSADRMHCPLWHPSHPIPSHPHTRRTLGTPAPARCALTLPKFSLPQRVTTTATPHARRALSSVRAAAPPRGSPSSSKAALNLCRRLGRRRAR